MRGLIFASYFIACGYVLAKTGADEELAALGRQAYGKLVAHTLSVAREAQREARLEVRDRVVEELARASA